MAKTYRRFIRMGTKVEASPQFKRKADADEWYREMLKKKHFEKNDLEFVSKNPSLTMINYSRKWLDQREKDFPKSTTYSDEQRLRDYILPVFAERPMNRITPQDVQKFLKKISSEGFRRPGFTISDKTLNKVKVLLSTIFNDAMNEDPPLVTKNPVIGVKLKSKKRVGVKKPSYIKNSEAVLEFLRAAKEIGGNTYVTAATILMAGLRKQELIALRWESIDAENMCLEIKEKYQQATNSIVPGTKGGVLQTRIVPIPLELLKILLEHKKTSRFNNPKDLIVCRKNGLHFSGRRITDMIEAVKEASGIDVTTHGLRHTYGREFALKTGNIKALQAILGHTSSSTTDLYSDLAGERIKGFGEAVSYDLSVKKRGR